ncbi:flagellar hook-basal body protein FliE [Arsukibacterium ikkense]|uniref:Flagellar hook-basal body complex protein FliE n=1 Tax=Arsukibacterium ikkense TaxID=336831 RepID=A0A0M2VBQ9_9GAMM|nr:flagellar hook-basal body complex protein FliE [Arsukibacterium ikkense]KKO47030.1 flagellar hook-basal body protein FliE [Arsukibacterium ikkense]
MNIKGQALYVQMQSMATQARSVSAELKPIQPLAEVNASQTEFSTLFKDALKTVNNVQINAAELRTRVEMGDPNVSLVQAMIAGQKSGLAFEATVQVRNKIVEAYKEIMAMPV